MFWVGCYAKRALNRKCIVFVVNPDSEIAMNGSISWAAILP